MMNRDRRSSSNDPTAERAVDQSTQSASGLSAGTGPDANDRPHVTRRETARAGLDTPRRYDQPIEDDGDPVMPTDDATVNTKI
jgi:hypothetical protein